MNPEENNTTSSMSLQKTNAFNSGMGTGLHRAYYTHIKDSGKQTQEAFKMHYTLLLPASGRVQTGSVLIIITARCSCCLALACGR